LCQGCVRETAVVMKDIIVDELQLGIAKEAGCDGVLLMASVLGKEMVNFMNLATLLNLETIVEVHTEEEIEVALECGATTLLVSNVDRFTGELHKDQALKLRESRFFHCTDTILTLIAGGGIGSTEECLELFAAGYDGVVLGRAMVRGKIDVEKVRRRVIDRFGGV
jgi:indole-3-glycerol phosphate synthase